MAKFTADMFDGVEDVNVSDRLPVLTRGDFLARLEGVELKVHPKNKSKTLAVEVTILRSGNRKVAKNSRVVILRKRYEKNPDAYSRFAMQLIASTFRLDPDSATIRDPRKVAKALNLMIEGKGAGKTFGVRAVYAKDKDSGDYITTDSGEIICNYSIFVPEEGWTPAVIGADEDDEDEAPKKPKKGGPVASPQASRRGGVAASKAGGDFDDEDEDEDEDEAPPPKKGKKPAKPAPSKKRRPEPEDDEDEDDEDGPTFEDDEDDEDEAPPPKKGKKAAPPPPKKGKPAPSKGKRRPEPEDDEDDEDEDSIFD